MRAQRTHRKDGRMQRGGNKCEHFPVFRVQAGAKPSRSQTARGRRERRSRITSRFLLAVVRGSDLLIR